MEKVINRDDTKTVLKTLVSEEFTLFSDLITTEVKARFDDFKNDMKNELQNNKPELPVQAANDHVTNTVWDDAARMKTVKVKSTMVIKPDQQGNKVSRKAIRKMVTNEGIPVDSLVESQNGDMYVNLPDETSRDRVSELLVQNHADNPVEKLQSKLPTISIMGITEEDMKNEDGQEFSRSDLEKDIYKQNKSIAQLIDNGSTLKVVYLKRPSAKQEYYTIGVRVSPDIRVNLHKQLKNMIYMGLRHTHIKDRFHVKRCNHCQTLGHYEEHCREASVCGYCAKSHKSDDCPDKRKPHSHHTCINCRGNDRDPHGHPTFWSRCPTYKEAQDKLKKSIAFDYGLLKQLN